MSKEELIPLITKVAELRDNIQIGLGERNVAKQKVDETLEGKTYNIACLNVGVLSEELMMAEEELKSAGLSIYNETKDKHPINKVDIKIYKELKYDPLKVLDWCKTSATFLLMLDKKAFEKVAETSGAPSLEVNEIAKCTIGTDLSQYLNERGE
jgi:hypothetical protein